MFDRAMTKIVEALRASIGILLILMVALNGANAFGRFVLQEAIIGADEILVFSMIWLVFLGVAVATWHRRHLSIDLLRPLLPKTAQRALLLMHSLLLAAVCTYIAVQSVSVVSQLGRIDQRSMAAQIPMTLPHAAIAVGLGLAAVFAVIRIFARPANGDVEKPRNPTL